MYGGVAIAIKMPSELMKHRFFMGIYFPLLCVSAFYFVPRPLFLVGICPIYISAWFLFHNLMGFLPASVCVYGPLAIAVSIYFRDAQDLA